MIKYLIKVIKDNEKAEFKVFIWNTKTDAIQRAIDDRYTVISKEKDILVAEWKDYIILKTISSNQLLSFFQKLGKYQTHWINIKDSIEKIRRYSKWGYYKLFLDDLHNSIEKWLNLYEAIYDSKFKKFFTYNQLEMIKVWINSDNLWEILKTLVEELKLERKIKRDIRSVMIMPTIAVILISISTWVLFLYVLPNILKSVWKIDNYPFLTQILINFKDILIDYKYFLLVFIFILIFLPYLLKSHPKTKYFYDYFIINIPIVKNLIKVRTYLQIAKILEITSKSHFSSKDKLIMLSKWLENTYYRNYFDKKIDELISWKEFYIQFLNDKLFSYDLSDVIQIWDETQNLEEMMCVYYNDEFIEFQKTIEDLKMLITTLIIIFLWVFVLLFAWWIFQLLLSLNETIR